jgi:hypothetical protein
MRLRRGLESFNPSAAPVRGVPLLVATIPREEKKADVVEHPEVFDHVGLLVNGPSSDAEVPFI